MEKFKRQFKPQLANLVVVAIIAVLVAVSLIFGSGAVKANAHVNDYETEGLVYDTELITVDDYNLLYFDIPYSLITSYELTVSINDVDYYSDDVTVVNDILNLEEKRNMFRENRENTPKIFDRNKQQPQIRFVQTYKK